MGTTEIPPELTPASVRSVKNALTEFGYSGLTDDKIAENGRHLLGGGEPRDIIEMFMRTMLRDAGLLGQDR